MPTILTKKKDTAGAPAPGDLTNSAGGAELAVNTFDKRLYTKDSGGNVVEIGTNPSTIDTTTVDTTNLEVTNIKAKDGTASATIANSTGKITVSTELAVDNLNLSGNTVSSTDTNGAINLAPNGTGQVVFNAGTVSAPAITTTGDTNTGIFFPAADTIAFTEGGVESMRITDAGNVAVGQSSSVSQFLVKGSSTGKTVSQFIANDTNTTTMAVWERSDGAVSSRLIYDGSGLVKFGTSTAHPLVFDTNNAERMRIDSAGNVGIGTSSPTGRLELRGASPVSLVMSNTNGAGYDTTITNSYSAGESFSITNAGTKLFAYSSTAAGGGGAVTVSAGAGPLRVLSGSIPSLFLNTSSSVDQIGFKGNTGSAGALELYTGGSESMRITSTGNVGIGTSSPANKFAVSNAGAMGLEIVPTGGVTSAPAFYSYNRSGAAWAPLTYYANYHVFGVSGTTEAMRIDSSGNVGIGTTSSTNKQTIQVSNTSTSANSESGLSIFNSARGNNYQATVKFGSYESNNTTRWTAGEIGAAFTGYTDGANSGALLFSTSNAGTVAERMRITAGGELLVGTTSAIGKLVVNNTGLSDTIYSYNTNGSNASASYAVFRASTTGFSMYFNINNNEAGKITHPTQTSTNYATTSDYRLKENIAPIQNALQTTALLNPVSFTWKSDKIADIGFIAHELQEVFPLAVSGKKDGIKEDGTPTYQSVDTARLVATLTAAIQELKAIVDTQAARIAALESK